MLLLLREWFDGQGSASQVLIGGMLAIGVYAVIAALTTVVARRVLTVEKPARHESGQKTANRVVWSIGVSIALLLLSLWGLEALGVPYYLAVGVGAGVLAGVQTGILFWASSPDQLSHK